MNTEKSARPVAKQDASGTGDVARREEEVLQFWKEHGIFNKSLKKVSPSGDFVFYDGPPFATGTPHYGHILAGTIKDAIPRFRTMRGYRVERKWGWDCHGLPLENIIEKKLGLRTKRDIEEMGVKQFNESARSAVMEYESVWREVVPRMGRFVDMDDDYKTMDSTYTESVWWVFSELNKKGLVYEGFKSMHLCPRCGTTLSNFEVNQGYKDIKDIAVTVKLPLLDEDGKSTDTSLLVWTTTPWTLPGNMASAVHKDFVYAKCKIKKDKIENGVSYEYVIVAKERAASVLQGHEYEITEEMKGEDLVGRSYVPPFEYWKTQEFPGKENAWKIYHADYVELGEEGTGAVHLAPAYGEEDMELAKREGVPIVHHVGEDGRFKDFVTDFRGELVKPKDDDDVDHKDADIKVLKKLQEAGKAFRKETVTHSYPHCWRCDTPLLNYATTSWFVRVTDLKDKLVEENAKVRWIPEHVGRARFGKWLEGARDWAISRQRYWGAPLPIWKNEKTGTHKVIGSLGELQEYVKKSGNGYFLMRHGESELNTKGTLNGVVGVKNGLTELGREQTCTAYDSLKSAKIDLIYHSPLERTEETARLVGEALGLPAEAIVADNRLREMGFGVFEGKDVNAYHGFFGSGRARLTVRPEGGESWTDVKRRAGEFLYEIEKKHEGKRILIVSHNGTLQMLLAAARGDAEEELGLIIENDAYDLKNAEVRELSFTPMPHNDRYELDYHRPYIDDIELFDEDGTKLVRVRDVFDCWFESGSMPYGQHHYPFEHADEFLTSLYPAQFIAEGLDQTRGWFYSLLVLGVALFDKSPFETVIVNGLTLAEDGKKMSKSLQNYPDPMELADRVGVDALRYYLLSSPIVRSEDLRVSEKEILEQQRKNLGRLHNVLAMYEMYADSAIPPGTKSKHVLDRWLLSRVAETAGAVTDGYENYELDRATRPLEPLIDDLSVWYLRRSRERLKADSGEDREQALATLRHTLRTLALLMAPVMPFYAEYLWRRVCEDGDAESVHLADWPEAGAVDGELLTAMERTRDIVTKALEARAKANIKVRQPLAALTVRGGAGEVGSEFIPLILDELNVKKVRFDGSIADEVLLDTNITPALRKEGLVRELIRAVQDARKEAGLNPSDRISLALDGKTRDSIIGFEKELENIVGATEIMVGETAHEVKVDDGTLRFSIVKV